MRKDETEKAGAMFRKTRICVRGTLQSPHNHTRKAFKMCYKGEKERGKQDRNRRSKRNHNIGEHRQISLSSQRTNQTTQILTKPHHEFCKSTMIDCQQRDLHELMLCAETTSLATPEDRVFKKARVSDSPALLAMC